LIFSSVKITRAWQKQLLGDFRRRRRTDMHDIGQRSFMLTTTSSQPFNAFLSGFSATVGQFVLTASLRIQTNPENQADFKEISHERYA
jgi:hypothetical protein